jgi:hypothetical protein
LTPRATADSVACVVKAPRRLLVLRLLAAVALVATLSLAPQAHSHSTPGAHEHCAACLWSKHAPSTLTSAPTLATTSEVATPLVVVTSERPRDVFRPLHGSRGPPR